MINDVRNTVLSILNKENRGNLTVEQFNLYAKTAQLDRMKEYQYEYNLNQQKRNYMVQSTGYADIAQRLHDVMSTFMDPDVLVYDGITLRFREPYSADPTKHVFMLGELIYNNSTVIDEVPMSKIYRLLASPDAAPTTDNPVYTVVGNEIQVYPTTIITNVVANSLRNPLDPKWTYASLSGGEPIFNQAASDYQDFELPLEDFDNLVVKILAYAGVTIREEEVANAAKMEETQEKQEQQ